MGFAERFKELRMRKRLTQREIADELGVGKSAVAMWEMGRRTPKMDTLDEIADYFNVNLAYLIGEENHSMYYLKPEVADVAQGVFDNPELKVLFDAAKDLSSEDIQFVIQFIERMK